MAFESGSVSLRIFYVPQALPADCVERFASHAAPPVEMLSKDEVSGWVTGRHLLDSQINADTAYVAGYLRLTLMKAERKIPEALLRAHCKMEELAELGAQGLAFLKRQARAEIRKAVVDRLLPSMPPTLTGIPIVYDEQNQVLYASATTEKQVDALVQAFRETTGVTLVPVTPEAAAMKMKRLNFRDLEPTSFSPDDEGRLATEGIGRDFLTWLWFFAEADGGLLSVGHLGELAVLLEGPLTFVREGEGAHETLLRKGTPLISAEAKTALLSGKKLRQAKMTLAREEEMWTVTVDADQFVLRGLKIPKGENTDPVGRFQERMLSIDTFRTGLMALFGRFLEDRADAARWRETCTRIQRWVSERTTKM